MANYTREEIARLAAIKKRISGKMESLDSPSSENDQGFLGDSVDAVQHGLLSGAADLTDGVGYLTGSDTIRKGADYLRGQADNQINQMSSDGREAFQGFGIQADESSPTGYGFKEDSSLKGFGLNVLSGVGSFAPTMIPGGIAAKGISAVGKVAGAAGKGVKVEKAIDKASDVVGFGGVGALSIGGSTGNQAYETVANADFHTLKDAKIFQKEYWNLRKLKELDHVSALKQARENVARELGTEAAKDGAIMGAITQGALGPVMGKLFRGEAGGIGKAAATGAITEGSQELVESGGQTAISNMAVNPAVPTDVMDNVVGDALTGAAVGGPVGGGFGAAGASFNRFRKPKDNTDDPLNLAEQDQGYQAVEQQLAEIEGLMVENGDNLTESEFAELEAKRNELLQRRAELTGEQPMDFAGPVESQAQPEQLALPNQNIIYGERPAPSQEQTQARENNRAAFEGQFGEPRNTGQEGEYFGQVFPENTEQQQDGNVYDGETIRDPLPLEAPQQAVTEGTVPQLNQQAAPETPLETLNPQTEAPASQPYDVAELPVVESSPVTEPSLESIAAEQEQSPPVELPNDSNEPIKQALDKAAQDTNTQPTEKQIEADNYKKGRVSLHGLDIAIENPKDSVRSGQDSDGKKWESKMAHHYGDIKGIKGADGDDLDVFIGDEPESDKAYIVDQVDPKTGEFDEHKVMLGFDDKAQAESGYLKNYEDGWKGVGAITEMPVSDFKEWIKSGDTTKPVSELMGGKAGKAVEAESNELSPVKLSLSNKPFKTETSARMSRTFRDTPNAEVVPVDDGFGVREVMKGGEPKGVTSEVKPNTQPVTKDPIKGMEENPTEQSVKAQDSTQTDTKALLKLSSTVKDDNKADIKGMEIDQVQKVVDGFLKEYNGNIPLKFRIEKTQEELYGPEATVKNIGRIYGAYHPKEQQFVLAAANLRDKVDVRKTLRHEIIGHYGLNTLLPKDKELLLEKITSSRNEPSLKSAWSIIDSNYSHGSDNVKAEEIFAFIAENEPKGLESVYDQILSTLNKGLRKVGLTKQSISRSELRVLAKRIGNQIKAGEKQKVFPKDDSSSFSKDAAKPTPKSLKAALKPLIDQLHEQNTFEVVQSVNDLPFGVRLQAKARLAKAKGDNPTLQGINVGDKNYLIADGIKDEKQAVEIFLHEVVGHKAVLDMLGKEGDSIMERIAYSYGPKQLQDLIKAYGADFKTKEGRIRLGKEKVATMAEKNEKPSLLGKLVANVKAWLRNYFPNIKWSDNDVLNMLATARDKVENRYMVKVDLDQAEPKSDLADNKVNLSIVDKKATKEPSMQEESPYDILFNTLGQKDKTVFQKAKDEMKRQFKAGGLLPDSVFNKKIARDSDMNASELEISAYLSSFRSSIKKAYGKDYSDLSDTLKQKLNNQMSSTDPDKTIPFSVRLELMKMRFSIKGLSQEYAAILKSDMEQLRNEGRDSAANEKAQLLETILGNLDTYTNRSYKAFDDPKWPKKVPQNILDDAKNYLESRYEGQGLPKSEIQTAVARTIRTILEEGTAYEDMGSFIKESKLGAKDLSTLKKRKEIAPEIRALLGEYQDVEVNFAKTVTKTSHLVANHKFLQHVRDLGEKEGFLFTEENRPLDKSVVKIAADGSEVMAPLNGFYTYPEIEQAFREALGKQGDMPTWLSGIIRLNGIVKYGKTVLSPTTAMRNIWSAFFFSVANGHFDISQMRKSIEVRKQYFGGDNDKSKLAYLKKLKSLGVIYDTPYAGEMMDLLEDSRLRDFMTNKKVFSSFTKLNDFAQKFYQYGDDMWKIMGWENEKAMLMKYKKMSESDAEVAAAERIRNTYPTYSMTGRFTQSLRRFPLAGTFVSFPAEIIRTSYHMINYLKQDFKESPAYARRKLAGLALVSSLGFAAQGISKALMGLDDDEEEAVRDMAAPWQKNSNILFTGRDENGNIQYLDMSFLDPYNYFKRPINAMLRDQPIQDMVAQSASEMLTPFFGEDITFSNLMEVYTNKKGSGGKVFNEQASTSDQTVDIANHLRKGLQPGFMSNMERMYKAMEGDVSASGKKYTVQDEMAALVGFRMSTLDPKTALYYQSFDFKQSKADAAKILKDVLRNPNKVSKSDLENARDTMLKARKDSYDRMMRLVKSAKKAGMTNPEIGQILKLSGVSRQDVMSLILGRMPKNDSYLKMAASISKRAEVLYGKESGNEIISRAKGL